MVVRTLAGPFPLLFPICPARDGSPSPLLHPSLVRATIQPSPRLSKPLGVFPVTCTSFQGKPHLNLSQDGRFRPMLASSPPPAAAQPRCRCLSTAASAPNRPEPLDLDPMIQIRSNPSQPDPIPVNQAILGKSPSVLCKSTRRPI